MNSWISAELGCPDLQGPEIMPLPSDPDSGGLGEGPLLLFTMCSGTGRSPWRAAFPPGWERPSSPAPQPQTVLTTISDESLGGPQTQICRPSPTLILFPQTLADSNRLRMHRFLSARQPLHPLRLVSASPGSGRLGCRVHSASLTTRSTQWGSQQQPPLPRMLARVC